MYSWDRAGSEPGRTPMTLSLDRAAAACGWGCGLRSGWDACVYANQDLALEIDLIAGAAIEDERGFEGFGSVEPRGERDLLEPVEAGSTGWADERDFRLIGAEADY